MTLIDFPKPKEAWSKPLTLEDWPWDPELGRPYGDINGSIANPPEEEVNDLARFRDTLNKLKAPIDKDATNPDHYKLGDIEVIQLTEKLGFCEGNIVKYVCRHKAKNGKEDLLKARWYLDRLIAGA
jgi:hypothetical protein